jgi:hypothetical protein
MIGNALSSLAGRYQSASVRDLGEITPSGSLD